MIPEPKFRLGDYVDTQFTGDVEGVSCTVTKRLIITGLNMVVVNQYAPYSHRLVYTLRELEPSISTTGGREYKLYEESLTPIEPLINEMKKVNP